jgi:uncharacterized YkwD family protein
MKRRILAASLVVFFALTLVSLKGSTAEAAQTFERVNFISGVVTANELNLRNGPSMNNDIIGVFKKNKWVNVLAQIGDWYAVFDPDTGMVGCVYKAYLANPANLPKTTATPAPSGNAPANPNPNPNPNPSPSTTPQQPSGDLSQEERTLLDLINKERANHNLAPLQADAELMNVARLKAKDMVQNNYFSHYSPTYGSPFDMMRQFGITFKSAAENIAGNSTIQGAVTSWMNSEGHRANILNGNYNATGIGIYKSNKYGYIFVQMFIRK